MHSNFTRFLPIAPAFAVCILLSVIPLLHAQTALYPVIEIPVEEQGTMLLNPFTGGLNNPQFSTIDLDGEGFDDLFIFDRTGDKVILMINTGTIGQPQYKYAPQYEQSFPEMEAWAMVEDFNCDDIPDLLCHVNTGMQIYEGGYVDDNLKFTSYSPLVKYIAPSGNDTFDINIWVARDDIPGVADIDNDGDLDIVSFGLFGSAMEYYQNRSMERNGNCDMVDFIGADFCWGHFQEAGMDNSIMLGSCKNGQSPQSQNQGTLRHAGSTVLAFDHDGDNDKDLILGDISFNTLVYLENGGDALSANMTSYDSVFPSYDKSVDIPLFPAAFSIDVDNDGLEDLIAAPNARNASVTHGNIWYYKNIGTSTNTEFSHQTDSFLVGDMLEFGKSSNVTFFNHNNDSLMDLIVGNYGYYKLGGNDPGSLALLENVGTTKEPQYVLVTRNYMNLSGLNLQSLEPSFADMDGDGDQDMILGEENGVLHYFKNNAAPGADASFVLTEPNMAGIDVGQFSVPCVRDMNGDSIPDLIIGRSDGKITYFQNIGSKSNPMFDNSASNQFFGEVDVVSPFLTTGHSNPLVAAIDSSGTQYLFVGSQSGTVSQYLVMSDSLLNGSFPLIDDNFGDVNVGSMATIAINDMNGDGELEYVFGNERGGLNVYSESIWDSTIVPPVLGYEVPLSDDMVNIFPNPSTGLFSIDLSKLEAVNEKISLQVFSSIGQMVLSSDAMLDGSIQQIDLTSMGRGVYFVRVAVAGKVFTKKIMLVR